MTLPIVAALEVKAGATYIIEVDRHITPDEAADLKAKLHALTGANFVVLSPNVRVVQAAS